MANCIRIGEAGVLRVMSELILRGHSPFKPAVDDHGVDLMLSTGIRIQVKTATLRTRMVKSMSHGAPCRIERTTYNLSLGWAQQGVKHLPVKRERSYSQECDYFIIFGVDESRFWIVPSFIMDGRACLQLGPRTLSPRKIRDLAAQGKGLKEISETLGVCETTVWQHKRRDISVGRFVNAVRSCENKWEFLQQPPLKWADAKMSRKEEIEVLEMMLEDTSQPSEMIKV